MASWAMGTATGSAGPGRLRLCREKKSCRFQNTSFSFQLQAWEPSAVELHENRQLFNTLGLMNQGGHFQLKDVSTTDVLIDSWFWRGLKIEHGRKG